MLKETRQGLLLDVEVRPNSGRFEVGDYDPWTRRVKIKVRQSPLEGKANKELVSELEGILGCGVEITAGHKSTKKTLLIKGPRREVRKRLGL
jgi:uncharacterized protein (TIGR00251 family)